MRNWKFKKHSFSDYPTYDGHDLGVFLYGGKLEACIWAPTAERILFRLYREGDVGEAVHEFDLEPGENGTWLLDLPGHWNGWFYTFQVCDEQGWLLEIPDIYAWATGINGKRGMACYRHETNPEGWEKDERMTQKRPTEMVIYEMHVRDFSIDPNSGMQFKGKFLGFSERFTKSSEGEFTGIEHLRELGVTHVHLLPVADFYTVDERRTTGQYNWGYDPLNYNTPEGWYATDAYDGRVRIREFKMMVQALHAAGIGVILDVVYNHTGLIFESYFNQTVPGYYYRQRKDGSFSDASGCGTELATERRMVRKYIVDSLHFWAEMYHIDGFRFDLMGVIDISTMNAIRERLDEVDPGIFLYGEGWTAGSSPLKESHRAVKSNTPKLNGIAAFSDDLRDALKGSTFDRYSNGFVSGRNGHEEELKFSIVGAISHHQIVYGYVRSSRGPWALSPEQTVNYVSCHDNYTLFDKLQYSCPEASPEDIERMGKLAVGIVLTSQGVPFLHGGIEMLRTKGGHHDSYRAPDILNQIDWVRKATFRDFFDFTRKCIELRYQHPAFRMATAAEVNEKLQFFGVYVPGVVCYTLGEHANGDKWRKILVMLNGNNYRVEMVIPREKYLIVASDGEIHPHGMERIETHRISLKAISMTILAIEE